MTMRTMPPATPSYRRSSEGRGEVERLSVPLCSLLCWGVVAAAATVEQRQQRLRRPMPARLVRLLLWRLPLPLPAHRICWVLNSANF